MVDIPWNYPAVSNRDKQWSSAETELSDNENSSSDSGDKASTFEENGQVKK